MGANWSLGILNCAFQEVAPRHGPQLGPETAGPVQLHGWVELLSGT